MTDKQVAQLSNVTTSQQEHNQTFVITGYFTLWGGYLLLWVGDVRLYQSMVGSIEETYYNIIICIGNFSIHCTQISFFFTGVIDPKSKEEISFDEAIKNGVINKTKGIYVRGGGLKDIDVQKAMNEGLIKVERVKTKKMKERKSNIGRLIFKFWSITYSLFSF